MTPPPPSDDARFLADLDVTVDLPLASLGTRALAQVVDLFLVGWVLVVVTFGLVAVGAVSDLGGGWMVAAWFLVVFLAQWAFFLGWELAWQGQTPGKRLFDLRVVRLDGTTLGPGGALLRNLLRPIDFFPAGYGVGVLLMFLTSRSQRLGDLAAGTLVVREGSSPTPVAARRWPHGFPAEDAALVEAFLARAPQLLPARRDTLGLGLLQWLRRDYPEFAASVPEGGDPWMTLEQLFAGQAQAAPLQRTTRAFDPEGPPRALGE